MRINHNISALKTNNQLTRSNDKLSKSLEKLSSSLRINHASDDAAGMAISQKMKTQIAGLEQASRNGADGISVIQTAEGAVAEMQAMVQRMRELSVQSANGSYTDADRLTMQAELDQLRTEVQRISETTEFNTKSLLNGNLDRRSYTNDTNLKVLYASDAVISTAPGDEYKISVTSAAEKAAEAATGAITMTLLETISPSEAGKIDINGVSVSVEAGDTLETIYEKIRNAGDMLNVNIFASNGTAGTGNPETAGYVPVSVGPGEKFTFVSDEYGSDQSINVTCDNAALAAKLGLTGGVTGTGTDAEVALVVAKPGFNSTATVKTDGSIITITDRGGFEMKLELPNGAPTTLGAEIKINVSDAGRMELQIGANENQTMIITIPQVNPKTMGIEHSNIRTEAGSQRAIAEMDGALNMLSSVRAKIGAYQNRLEHSIANLDVAEENMTEALSRIEDVNMATEMANYTQQTVLVQAGTSMLAQANQRPQTILSLLQG